MPINLKNMVIPVSIEAERAVLGALMLDNRSYDQIADLLTASDFYDPHCKMLFEVLSSLEKNNTPFDVLTVADALKARQMLDTIGEASLYELANLTPSAANILAYARIVREKAILRELLTQTTDIQQMIYAGEETDSVVLLDKAEQAIFKIGESQTRGQGVADLTVWLAQAANRLDQAAQSNFRGLLTGFIDLDQRISGLHAGELILIAGRPSMGKTTFALNIAQHVALNSPKQVLIFSMEMSGQSLAARMLSSWAHVNAIKWRTGDLSDQEWARVGSAVGALSAAKLSLDESAGLTPLQVRTRARRLARQKSGLSLIVIDYLQLMRAPGFKDNRVAEISEISRSLKELAKELNVPILALSQLNRGLENRADKRPVMSDLRESGALEQDADMILFIYRDEVYHPDSHEKGLAEIIVGKNRNGPTGQLKLLFRGEHVCFENYIATSSF